MGNFFPQPITCIDWGFSALCSNHGTCLPNIPTSFRSSSPLTSFSCECNPNWSGKGHMINLSSFDCSLHIPTAMVFHCLMILVHIRTLFICIKKSYDFLQAEKMNKEYNNITQTCLQVAKRAWKKHPGYRGGHLAMICSILGIIIGINQLNNIYIGDSIGSTLVYVLYLNFYWMTTSYYTHYFVKISSAIVSTSENEQEKIDLAAKTRIPPIILLSCVTIFQLGPTWAIGFTSSLQLKHILTCIWAFTWIAIYGPMAIALIKSNTVVATIFEKSHQQTFLEQVHRYEVAKGLRGFVKGVKVNLIMVTILYALAFSWPWFRTRFTYVLPLLMTLQSLSFGKGTANLSTSGGMTEDDSISIFFRLINDVEAFNIFQTFLAKEFSSENLNFWIAVEDFREFITNPASKTRRLSVMASSTSTRSSSLSETLDSSFRENSALLASAKHIYLTFIAPEVVNLPDSIRTSLSAWFRDLHSKEETLVNQASSLEKLSVLFSEAQLEIFNLLRTDPLRRFQKTKEFIKLKKKWQNEDFLLVSKDSKGSKGSKGGGSLADSERNLLAVSPATSPISPSRNDHYKQEITVEEEDKLADRESVEPPSPPLEHTPRSHSHSSPPFEPTPSHSRLSIEMSPMQEDEGTDTPHTMHTSTKGEKHFVYTERKKQDI